MQQSFLPRIESLRGLAALAVLTYHVCGHLLDVPSAGWIDASAFRALTSMSNGLGAVVAFFVISGFVLTRSLVANPDPLRYFRNRFFRLFPAAAVAVALFTAFHQWFGIFVGYEGDFSPGNVVLNMLMIRTDINGVMWSMKVECAATPLILFSVWLAQRNGANWLWAIIALLFALSFWGPYVHALGDGSNLAPFYAFVVGVLLHQSGERLMRGIDPSLATLGAFLSVIVFCICGLKKQTAPILMLECLSAASLVALVAWQQTPPVFRFLDFSVVRFYGRISYSFYLLHTLGILFAFRISGAANVPLSGLPVTVAAALLTILSVLITTPAAYLSWRFVEIPFINFTKKVNSLGRVDIRAVI